MAAGGKCDGPGTELATSSFTADTFALGADPTKCQSQGSTGCFHGACCVLLLDQSGDPASLTLDHAHRALLLGLFALWFTILFWSFIKESLLRGRYGGQDSEKGETRKRKMWTAQKLVSSFLLVVTSFVLLDGLCRCAGTMASFGGDATTHKKTTSDSAKLLQGSTRAVCQVSAIENSSESIIYAQLATALQWVGKIVTTGIMSVTTLGAEDANASGAPPQAGHLGYGHLIVLGIIMGFCGDVALTFRRKPKGENATPAEVKKAKRSLLGGIFFFALGHLAYVQAFALAGKILTERHGTSQMVTFLLPKGDSERSPQDHFNGLLNALRIIWYSVGMWAWKKNLYGGSIARTSVLGYIGLLYTALIAETAAKGSLLTLMDPTHFMLLGIGLAMFLVSDIAVGASAFKEQRTFMGSLFHISDFIWLTYGPAQCLIAFSMHALWLSFQVKA